MRTKNVFYNCKTIDNLLIEGQLVVANMGAINGTATQAQGLLQGLNPWYSSAVLLPLLLLLVLQPWSTSKEPPSMRATIPYISNGYQYLANKPVFFKRLE